MDEAERAGHFALMSKGRPIAHGIPADERRNFQFAVYTLPTDRARAVKEQLCRRNEFRSVNLFGNSVHIVTDKSFQQENVKTVLESERLESASLQQIVPTFEDIYIALSTG
jgi:ABC-type multidrug transport system ATPase subunit